MKLVGFRASESAWQFNPSIVKHGSEFIVTFRETHDVRVERPRLSICRLDASLRVVEGSHRCLSSSLTAVNPPLEDYWHADARLFWRGSRLYLTYNHGTWPNQANKMYIAEICPATLEAKPQVHELRLRGMERRLREKNWLCFENDRGELRIIYMIEPHIVLATEVNGDYIDCYPVHMTRTTAFEERNWKAPRGSTHPVRIGDSYYSVFHEVRTGTFNSYYGSIYKFSAARPHGVTAVSPIEIFVPPPEHENPFNPVARRVVYPCGACLYDPETLVVSCGYRDREMGLALLGTEEGFPPEDP